MLFCSLFNVIMFWHYMNFNFFLFGGRQEAQLTKAHSDRDSRRRLKGQITDEKNALMAHVELLERLVSLRCINTTYFSGDQHTHTT